MESSQDVKEKKTPFERGIHDETGERALCDVDE